VPGRSLVALLLLLTLACHSGAQPEAPVPTYLAFLKDLREGDADAAFSLLSKATREALDARVAAVSKAEGSDGGTSTAALVFQGPLPPAPTEVKVVEQTAERATLEVTGAKGTERVQMVREAGSWRIDLSPTLR
jgi:hypothetical protein